MDLVEKSHGKQYKKLQDKSCKGTKKFVAAESLIFNGYNSCLYDGKQYAESRCYLRIRNSRCTRYKV